MNISIRVSGETMERLKACAQPFVDKGPEDVIRRLLKMYESSAGKASNSSENASGDGGRSTGSRVPRERGVRVRIFGREIQAVSVGDLYKQVLTLLVDKHKPALQRIIPYKTSSQRFLIAMQPIHPSGNRFVVPVDHHGFYMEAHKDYANAIRHLQTFVERLGFKLEYLG